MSGDQGKEFKQLSQDWCFWEGLQPRILALLTFRDEMPYLPGFFENVVPHVDGIIALDDGSTDGSAEFVASQHSVLELLRKPVTEPHVYNDGENHRLLVEAAWRYDPDWLIGVDADERLERNFRIRALREIERGKREGHLAYSVVGRELWDGPDTYRVDGIWGKKRMVRFFKARLDHEFDNKPLHAYWAPLNSRRNGKFPKADLVFYHLRMIHRSDRRARQVRYKRLDPEKRWQVIGYDYMSDEQGLRLERLPPGREYKPLGELPSGIAKRATDVLSEAQQSSRTPLLACVVISFRNQPGLVAAVRSLLAQNRPLEIVVVNSGGGDPAGSLRGAGIDQVQVINVQERLYVGAARNMGIDATRAPYVAFLAADCTAEDRWAARRLKKHRAGALAVASALVNPYPNNYYAWASYILLRIRRAPGMPPSHALLFSVSYARELFDRFGRFREDLPAAEDTYFNRRFKDTVPIEWDPTVRTAHRGEPMSFGELIRDQYARGKRWARSLEKIKGRPGGRIIVRRWWTGLLNSMAWSWIVTKPRDRGRLPKAWLLMLPASAAYSLGAFVSGLGRSTEGQDER